VAYLIDDEGRAWSVASQELRKRFHVSGSNASIARNLVRLVGCIRVRITRTFARIEFNPETVSEAALAQLFYMLFDCKVSKAGIFIGSGNVCHAVSGLPSIVRTISDVVERRKISTTIECTTTELDPNLIDQTSPFGALLRRCSELNSRFDFEDFSTLLDVELNGRWLVVEPQGSGDDMRVVGCGTGYGVPTPDFCRQLSGSMLSSLPDQKYAKWVAKSYSRAAHCDVPQFQSARSVAYWTDRGLVASEYVRLLVPMTLSTGRKALLSTSRRFSLRNLGSSSVA
jgi:hypothetical protein